MNPMQTNIALLAIGIALSCAMQAPAADIAITGGRDTSIQSDNTSGSNGAGPHLFIGQTLNFGNRRALIWFDLTSSVPPSVTITSAVLRLVMDRNPSPPPGSRAITLHRLTRNWGEAESLGGGTAGGAGGPAQTNDATWLHTFFPGSFWNSAGGDFVAPATASTSINTPGVYTWSSAQLVSDVQAALDSPSASHGWMLIGNEAFPQSAARFVSRENSTLADRPMLLVGYTADPVPGSISDFVWEDLNTNGLQDFGEPGISNIIVRLYDANTNLLSQTMTATNGLYAFTNLLLGAYQVAFEAPFGWAFSPMDAGDDALDSDADPETGFVPLVSLGPGEDDDSVDAGLYAPFVVKTLYPIADTTIYQDPDGLLANGGGAIMFAGRSNQASNSIRRALLRFDVRSAIPWESEVLDAELSMTVKRASGPGFQVVALHRATNPWGEGASTAPGAGGGGTQAEANDATWLHTHYSNQFWALPGGDFEPAVSAAQAVSTGGVHVFSSSLLVDDVQQWVDSIRRDSDGWVLRGNELSPQSNRGFGTREQTNAADRPALKVIYVPHPPRSSPFLIIR